MGRPGRTGVLEKKGRVPLNIFSLPRRPLQPGIMPGGSAVFFFLVACWLQAMAQGNALSKINVNSVSPKDSLSGANGMAQKDSGSKNTPVSVDSLSMKRDTTQRDSLLKNGAAAQQDMLSKKRAIDTAGLTNIVLTQKNIRATGWGEYQVGGKCLCCDNLLDGDCVVVHTTNRTEKWRIKQIIDGKTEADTNDKSTYFGDVSERDKPKPVSLIMAEIDLKKMTDVLLVVVYTMVDKEKKKNYLSNCELGYYDQFDRLQWVGKAETGWWDDHIAFRVEKPILTKSILLKVKDGRNRITEVAIFSRTDNK